VKPIQILIGLQVKFVNGYPVTYSKLVNYTRELALLSNTHLYRNYSKRVTTVKNLSLTLD